MVDFAEPGLNRLGHQEGYLEEDGNGSLKEYLETSRTSQDSLSHNPVHLHPTPRTVPVSTCVLLLHLVWVQYEALPSATYSF